MGYSIELYFDFQFEKRIRLLWDELEESGVPSILNKIGSRPHLSLAVMETFNEFQASNILREVIKGNSVFSLEFPAIALIPGRDQTVLLAPAPNITILEMQKTLFKILHRSGNIPLERYEPNKWLPHCSISKELSPTEALKTIDICRRSSVTGEARVIEIGIIEFRPRKEIHRVGLGNQ